MDLAHTKSVEQVFEFFSVDEKTGLSLDEIKLRQEKYGPNGTYISPTHVFLIFQQSLVICDEKSREKMNENDSILSCTTI